MNEVVKTQNESNKAVASCELLGFVGEEIENNEELKVKLTVASKRLIEVAEQYQSIENAIRQLSLDKTALAKKMQDLLMYAKNPQKPEKVDGFLQYKNTDGIICNVGFDKQLDKVYTEEDWKVDVEAMRVKVEKLKNDIGKTKKGIYKFFCDANAGLVATKYEKKKLEEKVIESV